MDPKQTSPLGNNPAGGQEGQNGQPAGTQPVFGAAGGNGAASNSTMAGQLGAANLSTGANVSRTMDSLNSKNQSATGTSVFSKHKFDKVDPDGAIIIPGSSDARMIEKKGLSSSTKLKLGIGAGTIVAIALIVAIVFAFVSAPKKENVAIKGVSAEDAYYDYINYLFWGDETPAGDYDVAWDQASTYNLATSLNESDDSSLYFEKMLASYSSDERTSYFENLNNLYTTFLNAYGSGFAMMENISIYLHDFAMVGSISDSKLQEYYLDNGKEETKNYLKDLIKTDSTDGNIQDYVSLKLDLALSTLDAIDELQNANCLSQNTTSLTSAYEQCTAISNSDISVEYQTDFITYALKAPSMEDELYWNAMTVLRQIYESYNTEVVAEENVEEVVVEETIITGDGQQ
ncbi:hypothetical protein IK112_03220 [Candidatus Saccharibacteria bacterium]|nr:hypothetical protein [Candidatus Saccharibacteria bacterium]